MERELWKRIDGFSLYEVSNLGRVRSKDRISKNGNGYYLKNGKILKSIPNNKGYLRVELKENGRCERFFVHRLVALAFIENPYNKPLINHKDNNPKNNKADNLEWCTQKENMEWAQKQGRTIRTKKWLNNLHKAQETTYKPVVGINIISGEKIYFKNLNSVKEKGFQSSNVCKCCKGLQKEHKGYIFNYA